MLSGLKHQLTYFDLVRGISAELVVLGHAAVLAFPGALALRGPDGYLGARPGFHVQSYGVVIFLVLSGYLISMSVRRRFRDPNHGFSQYMIDRAARILTPLLPAVVLVFVVDHLVFRDGVRSQFVPLRHDATTVVSNVLLLQDNLVVRWLAEHTGIPLAARSLGSAAPWWTVALEWWIYIAFGIVALVLVKRTVGRGVTVALIPLLVFALVTVGATVAAGSGLALAWVVGFGYAWFGEWVRRVPRPVHGVVVLLAVAFLVHAYAIRGVPVYDHVADVVTAMAVMSGFHVLPWDVLLQRMRPALAFASNVSYSVYLIHFSVIVWLAALVPEGLPGRWRAVLFVVCGNLAGIAWWWLFERHFPKVRQWLRARLSRHEAAVDEAEPQLAGAAR